MRTSLVTSTLLCALLAAGSALAGDAPHDASTPGIGCMNCHAPHRAASGRLLTSTGNANLCQSCHDSHAPSFGFAWSDNDQAIPDIKGDQHSWSGNVTSTQYGAKAPTSTNITSRLSSWNLTCSACHDQHSQLSDGAGGFEGRQYISVASGTALGLVSTPRAGVGTVKLGFVSPSASPMGYLLGIALPGQAGSSTFQISNDNGISWTLPAATASGTPVYLNDGTKVSVIFSGSNATSFVTGDQFGPFYVSYPFLRVATSGNQLCASCHYPRVLTSGQIELGNGTSTFSHPVGEALSAPYDRFPTSTLAADGSLNAADPIVSNRFVFGKGNTVTCLTCHAPHNADSNSLTEDGR